VRAGEPTNSNTRNAADVVYNIYFNGRTPAIQGPHDQVIDPLFVAPGEDPTSANFRLKPASPAIDSGTASMAPAIDLPGDGRPRGSGVDRGAAELPQPPFYNDDTPKNLPIGQVFSICTQ
jgi:hypothetical protein